jgi:hypothetical protein
MKRVFVTPQIAAQMLAKNVGNRAMRNHVVKQYAQQMREGHWRETHEPIAVDASQNIVDGQHRLAAIVESGASIWFWLATYDQECSAVDLPIDMGMRRRMSDVLRVDRRITEVASVIHRLVASSGEKTVTVDSVRRVLRIIGPQIELVVSQTKKTAAQRTSASVRAAVVLRCVAQPDFAATVADQYQAFVWMDFARCWPSVLSLLKQFDSETKRTSGGGSWLERDRMARTWKAFDWTARQSNVIRVGDTLPIIEEMKTVAVAAGI